MAEFDELERRLRDALGHAAEPGDSTGVADAIRARVTAGDPGFPAAAAPGWSAGVLSWLPWLGLIVVAGVVGVAVGASGIVGAPEPQVVTVLETDGVLPQSAPAYFCPGGPVVGQLHAGDRVVAVQRSDDDAYLGVRDPRDVATVLWLDASAVVVDDGEAPVSSLPVGACPEVVIAYPSAEPTAEPEPQPGPGPAPGPSDTTAPSANQYWASPTTIYQNEVATIHLIASDDVAVTGVTISWGGAATGSGSMTFSGGEWRYSFPRGTGPDGVVTFTMRAVDAAGNQSAPVQVQVTLSWLI